MTDVTPDSVSLSWTVSEGEFDSFVIKYKDRDGQPQVVSVAADQLEVTVPGLEPSRKYKFMLFGIQDGRRHGPVSVEAKTGERNPHEAEPEALAFLSFSTLPGLISLVQVSPLFTSSVSFENSHCPPQSKADENQENGASSWIHSPS